MTRSKWILALAKAAAVTSSALAQTNDAPRNDLPQPYRTTRDWGELPPGTKWAAVTAIEQAPDGSIYVIHRCKENSCAGRSEPPILKFDTTGKLLKAWGEDMFVFPHGSTVDAQGNLWVTDAQGKDGKGHQVFKFDPDGKVLMTLGKAGVSGSGPDLFDQPTDVVVAPNGDIFVTDGHRNGKNNRVVKFTKDGKFIKEWGKNGSGPGEILRAAHHRHRFARAACSSATARTTASRSSIRTASSWTHGASAAAPAASSSRRTTPCTSPIPNPVRIGRNELTGIKKGIRIGSAKTARSPPSSKTWNRPPPTTAARKASASMRMATSMAPSCAVRCSNAT